MSRQQVELFRQLWETEYENTLSVIKAIPDSQMSYAPWEGAMPLRRLALHVIGLEEQFIRAVAAGEAVTGGSRIDRPEVQTSEQMLRFYEVQHAGLRDVVADLDDVHLGTPMPFKLPNGVVVRTLPGSAYLFSLLLLHLAHHRGQLLVYLRMLGQPVPGPYGPTREQTPPGIQ